MINCDLMKCLSFFLFILISFSGFAQVDPIDKNGLAIGGYDLVSYFKSGKARKGHADIAYTNNNVTYYFSSEENRTEFVKSPENYLPQYEGYCALAIGTTKKKISIDPETFKVTDGKLYLFFHGKSFSGTKFNSLDPWIKDETNLIKKSNENWPVVKQKKYTPM
jgi:YHS domain-containing protein